MRKKDVFGLITITFTFLMVVLFLSGVDASDAFNLKVLLRFVISCLRPLKEFPCLPCFYFCLER